jgi:2-methylcitrate dehydratase
MPEQFEPERIAREDAQALLRRVEVRPADDLSARFPDEHACRLRLRLRDGRLLTREKRDYEGFRTRPMSWETVRAKYEALLNDEVAAGLGDRIAATVMSLDELQVSELSLLLEQVRPLADGAGSPSSPVVEGAALG